MMLAINNDLLAMSLANSIHKEIAGVESSDGTRHVLLSVQMTQDVLDHIVALLMAERKAKFSTRAR